MDVGIFAHRFTQVSFCGRPALFLDRDGVIVEDTGYLHRVSDIAFIPGVVKAVAQANRASIAIVMVTNQAGIGRGLYDWKDFATVQQAIYTYYSAHGSHFDMALACAYHGDGIGAYAVADHPWRKPNPGMLFEAARILGIDLAHSFIVGDRLSDLAAGHAAGLMGGTLVATGHGRQEWASHGEELFARWQAKGRFLPHRAESAQDAIDEWMREQRLTWVLTRPLASHGERQPRIPRCGAQIDAADPRRDRRNDD